MHTLLPQIGRSLRHTLRTARPSQRLASTATPCLYSLSTESDSWINVTKMAIAENYDDVLQGKYPAKEHAKKVKEWLLSKGGDKNGTIYLEAQKQKLNEDNDGEAPFRYDEHGDRHVDG